jgi:hypothetical protein
LHCHGGSRETHLLAYESAATFAGKLLQTTALAGFWSVMVLPAPGQLPWAVTSTLGGVLFAYVAFRAISERWAPARREKVAGNLVWATTLPAAVLALAVAFWPVV